LVPPNKALEALVRLCDIGALHELPHVGRPYPRVFQRKGVPYWQFVANDLALAARERRQGGRPTRGGSRA
jgi:hypothetical protein